MPNDPYLDFTDLEQNPLTPWIPINAAQATLSASTNALLTKTLTSSNLDLTINTGTAPTLRTQYYNMRYLRILGVFTATRTVTVPATARDFIVEHAGTVHDLTIKTPSGTGVTLTSGTTQALYCDGTNVVPATGATGAGGQPYDQGFYVNGMPGDGALLYKFGPTVRNWRLPAGLAGSDGDIEVPAADGDAVFTLKKNASTIGTLTAANGASVFTVSFASDVDFLTSGRHIFRVFGPSPQDSALADFSFLFKAIRL